MSTQRKSRFQKITLDRKKGEPAGRINVYATGNLDAFNRLVRRLGDRSLTNEELRTLSRKLVAFRGRNPRDLVGVSYDPAFAEEGIFEPVNRSKVRDKMDHPIEHFREADYWAKRGIKLNSSSALAVFSEALFDSVKYVEAGYRPPSKSVNPPISQRYIFTDSVLLYDSIRHLLAPFQSLRKRRAILHRLTTNPANRTVLEELNRIPLMINGKLAFSSLSDEQKERLGELFRKITSQIPTR